MSPSTPSLLMKLCTSVHLTMTTLRVPAVVRRTDAAPHGTHAQRGEKTPGFSLLPRQLSLQKVFLLMLGSFFEASSWPPSASQITSTPLAKAARARGAKVCCRGLIADADIALEGLGEEQLHRIAPRVCSLRLWWKLAGCSGLLLLRFEVRLETLDSLLERLARIEGTLMGPLDGDEVFGELEDRVAGRAGLDGLALTLALALALALALRLDFLDGAQGLRTTRHNQKETP